jgi:hypothetical protein
LNLSIFIWDPHEFYKKVPVSLDQLQELFVQSRVDDLSFPLGNNFGPQGEEAKDEKWKND